MSYYNEIAIVLRQEDKEEFLKQMAEFDEKHEKEEATEGDFHYTAREIYDMAETHNDVVLYRDYDCSSEGTYFLMHWKYASWWSPRICCAYKFYWNTIVDFKCDFIRIGEDAGDIEEHHDLHSGIISPHVEQDIMIFDNGKLKDW